MNLKLKEKMKLLNKMFILIVLLSIKTVFCAQENQITIYSGNSNAQITKEDYNILENEAKRLGIDISELTEFYISPDEYYQKELDREGSDQNLIDYIYKVSKEHEKVENADLDYSLQGYDYSLRDYNEVVQKSPKQIEKEDEMLRQMNLVQLNRQHSLEDNENFGF